MKKYLVLLSIFLLFIPSAFSSEFWASKNSNKYHYPDCRWAQKIKPNNLIKFNSPEAATKAGYIPCKVCRPPVFSKSELKTNDNFTLAKLQIHEWEPRSGCCSWHGGVCGCASNGRVICCDGTLSPTCYCW